MKHRVLTLLLWMMTAGPALAQSDGEWLWLHPSAGVNSLVDIAVIDSRTAVAVGERSTIARTEDAGKTWQVTDSTWASGHWNAVHFSDPSNGWVAGRNGRIYYSADAGRTWHPQHSGTSRHLSDIHFIDSSTGWIVGSRSSIKKFHREPPVAHPELLHPVDGASELEELPELQWDTVDGADSYLVQLSKTYVFNTRAVEVHDVTRTALMPELPDGLEPEGTWYWRVASKNEEGVSHWSEVRSFSMAVPSDAGLPEDLPGDVFLEQNYPNPFNPSTRIRFALPGQVHVHLTVYDLLGRKVAVLVDEVRPGGWHAVTFNADRLSSGVFFYRLEAGGSIQTGKMLYIK